MKIIVILTVAVVITVQAKRRNPFNKQEEDCLSQIGVSRDVVLQDKGLKFPGEPKADPKFTDYLECYRQKLDQLGKLSYTKNAYVHIPGYRTPAYIKGIECTKEDLSGKGPARPCVISPETEQQADLLNKEEEQCISKTSVHRQVVLQDKGHIFTEFKTDPKFRDYLECYRDKLDELGVDLYNIKSTEVTLPGYKTPVSVPGIYCTEDDLTGKAPPRQCAMRPELSPLN